MKFLKRLKKALEKLNKDRHYAYYAFPALLTMLITFGFIRALIDINPNFALMINGLHVHHFSEGIFILMITGYLSLWLNEPEEKYILALAYGSGVGFVLDEFYMWLRLDPSKFAADRYSAIVIGACVFLIIILWPMGMKGLRKLFRINHQNNNGENKTVFD